MMEHYQQIGISSKEEQAQRCLIKLYPQITTVRMRQAGLMDRIQQCLEGIVHAKFVFFGLAILAVGLDSSGS